MLPLFGLKIECYLPQLQRLPPLPLLQEGLPPLPLLPQRPITQGRQNYELGEFRVRAPFSL